MTDEVLNELKSIKKLLALQAVKDKDFREQVLLLNSIGFQPKEIGEIIGKTANAVSIALHRANKGRKNVKK